MPVPLLIPILLAAASMGANMQAQKKVNRARTAATGEARRRRESKEKETAARAQSTADLLTRAGSDEQTRAAELEQTYKSAGRQAADPTRPAGMPLDATRTSPMTTVEDTTLRDRMLSEADALAKGRAQLGSFGDVMTGNQIAVGRNAQGIDQANAGLRNWNEYVLPAQLNAANLAGRDWNTFADVLQAASMLTGYASLAKGGAAAGAGGSDAAKLGTTITDTPIGTTTQFGYIPDFGNAAQDFTPGLTTNFMKPGANELAWLRGLHGGKLPPVRF